MTGTPGPSDRQRHFGGPRSYRFHSATNKTSYYALAISIVAILTSFFSWLKSEDTARWGRAMSYAPALRVDAVSFDDSVRLSRDAEWSSRPGDSSLYIQADGAYFICVKLRNIGTATARLVAHVCFLDTSSGRALDALLKSGSAVGKPAPPRSVAVGDTYSLREPVMFPSATGEQGEVRVHVVLFYENPEGALYDTYIWATASPVSYSAGTQPRMVALEDRVMVRGPAMSVGEHRYDCVSYTPSKKRDLFRLIVWSVAQP